MADNAFRRIIRGCHAQYDLDRTVIEEASIATDDQGFPVDPSDAIKNGLHVVFQKTRPPENSCFLAKTTGSGFLALNRSGAHILHRHFDVSCSYRLALLTGVFMEKYNHRVRIDLHFGHDLDCILLAGVKASNPNAAIGELGRGDLDRMATVKNNQKRAFAFDVFGRPRGHAHFSD